MTGSAPLVRLAPRPGPVAAAELAAAFALPSELPPFAPEILDFLNTLHRRLLSDLEARALPDLQALAFELRPAALARLKAGFEASLPAGAVAVPRGLALHVPPANVDTMLFYSWLPALLTGNRNIVRVSERLGATAAVLLRLLAVSLEDSPVIADSVAFVSWPRDDRAITAALSRLADARLLWGGDDSVTALRAIPAAAHTLDLGFPDRVSRAVLKAEAYLALSEPARQSLAEALAHDLFRFDQQACASPRLLVWCGTAAEADRAGADLYPRLAAQAVRVAGIAAPGARLERLTGGHRAILDLPVIGIREYGAELTVIRLNRPQDLDRAEPAACRGLLPEARIAALTDLAPAITRRTQTLVHFGFSGAELAGLARTLNGRGIDRMVPPGRALTFSTLWDGTDLLRALVRLVTVLE
ncbi:MAG: acyl-CoA reductase [Rhodospirillaceae bacterium]